ncbi:MAG: CDP-glycerol glycerophosphotransferase family protein [Lachnospiraceae bacterium]|nr:CDP-glycerol glycerophosphotransferase family protein [Lachnospiraceae bacterium]
MNLKLFLKQYIKMFSQNCMLPVYYAGYAKKPVKPGLTVFADAHHDARPENMQLLYEALEQKKKENPELNLEIRELYLNYQKASPAAVLKAMFQFMKWYAQAGSVVICDNFLPAASCKKRKETKVVQLWHACGSFKKFGYDTEDDIPKQYHGNVFQNTDLVTVSAPGCVKPFASAMRLEEKNVQPIGVSRTDVYYSSDWKENCRREFYSLYPEAAGKRVILWAPTFRGNPGEPQLVKLNLQRLQQKLGDEWLVISHVHPHMHEQYKDTDCKMASERLFPVTDVLIADYSSLIYEYLLFDGTMVLYVPDLEEYQSKRGFYLDFDEIPGTKVFDEEELPEVIERQYENWKRYGADKSENRRGKSDPEKRKQFIQKYMSNCDGHATERIVEYILEGVKS